MRFPLSKSITTTFAYLKEEWLTLLKILWLPVLLMQVILTVIVPRYMEASFSFISLGDGDDPSEALGMLWPFFGWIGVMMVLSFAAYAVIYSGVLRHILRGEKPSAPFYLQFGGDEARLFLTMLAGMLVIGIAYIGGMIAFFAVAFVLSLVHGLLAGIVGFFGFFVFLGGMIWFCMRLSLALPAAIDVNRVDLGQSWKVTKGNAWSLFVYWGLMFLIVGFFAMAYSMIVMPDYFSNLNELIAAGSNEAEVNRINLEMMKQSVAMYDISNPRFLLLAIATYIYSFVLFALLTVSSGVAYWLTTSDEARALES